MTNPHNALPTPDPDGRRNSDDALLADLTAPPSLQDAQEAYDYWTKRRAELPRHKRHERKEAEQMVLRWKQRLAAARRERYGPRLLDQVLDTLGIRWRPNPRRIILTLSALALIMLVLLVVLTGLVIIFWPQIGPIVNTLLNNDNNGGGG
ncbi:MAG: hypothetical protein M3022_02560 [Actinomycetota bacterium]|nr:hypothetical protein [Actinomycetota bacterium]